MAIVLCCVISICLRSSLCQWLAIRATLRCFFLVCVDFLLISLIMRCCSPCIPLNQVSHIQGYWPVATTKIGKRYDSLECEYYTCTTSLLSTIKFCPFFGSMRYWPTFKKLCTFFSESKVWQGVFLQIDVFILVKTYRDGAQLPSDFTEMHLVASAVLWVCDVLRIYDFEFQ